MTAQEVVDDFCLKQGNMRRAGILQAYVNLRWAYKDMFRYTLWDIKTQALPVDCHTDTINLPVDCERVINLSVVDMYGKLHPLGFNTDFNTTQIRCLKPKCGCGNCNGQNTLCSAIDSVSAVQTPVTIEGHSYMQTTIVRYNGNGTIQRQITQPSWDVESSSVIFNTSYETLCNVETTERGCIKITQPNMDALRTYAGCGNFIDNYRNMGFEWGNYSAYRQLIPSAPNYWGQWNYNAADRTIVHIFGHPQNLHFNNTQEQEDEWRSNIRQVILSYQTNGETPGQEIMVPEYAVIAVQVGMAYMQKIVHPKASADDKREAKWAFNAEKNKVFTYLNPVRMTDMVNLQTAPHRW